MPDPLGSICSCMAWQAPLALAMAATALAIGGTPLSAQSSTSSTSAASSTMTVGHQAKPARPRGRLVSVPGYPYAYVVPVAPKDPRTPRQQCLDSEIEKEGGHPSDLAMASIDLKCSQR